MAWLPGRRVIQARRFWLTTNHTRGPKLGPLGQSVGARSIPVIQVAFGIVPHVVLCQMMPRERRGAGHVRSPVQRSDLTASHYSDGTFVGPNGDRWAFALQTVARIYATATAATSRGPSRSILAQSIGSCPANSRLKLIRPDLKQWNRTPTWNYLRIHWMYNNNVRYTTTAHEIHMELFSITVHS